MAKPLIAYVSMLRLATTTVADPGTASGFSIANISDMKSYNVWKSNTTVKPIEIDIDNGASPQNANYIGLVNHNLFTLGATVKIMADTFTPPTTQRMAATAVTEDGVSLLTFSAPGALRYWRVEITVAGASFAAPPFIGDLWLGLRTDLPEYVAPSFDPFFKDVDIVGSRSDGGHYLAGISRGQLHRGVITFGAAGAARSWFTSDGNAFIDNHALKRFPFFFTLDTADTDFDSPRYVKVPDTARIDRLAIGGAWTRLTFNLPVEEAFMEVA
jgi:hypothetical protein